MFHETHEESLMTTEAQINEIKIKANEFYANEKYTEALNLYTKCIELMENMSRISIDDRTYTSMLSVIYSNRAACNLKIQNFILALDDCDRAIELDDKNIKAIYRKCLSLENLCRYEDAFVIAKRLHESNPNITLYTTLMKKLTNYLYQKKYNLSNPMYIAEQICNSINTRRSIIDQSDEDYQKLLSLCSDKNVYNKIVATCLDDSNNFNILKCLCYWLELNSNTDDLIRLSLTCYSKIVSYSSNSKIILKICNDYVKIEKIDILLKHAHLVNNYKLYVAILNHIYQMMLISTTNIELFDKIFDNYVKLWLYNDCMHRSYFIVKLAKHFSICTINLLKSCDNRLLVIDRLYRMKFHLKYIHFVVDYVDTTLTTDINDNYKYLDEKDILLILESSSFLLATFESTLFSDKPLDSKNEFVTGLKNELNSVTASLEIILSRYIVLKSVPKLYEDFYIEDGPYIMTNISHYILESRAINDRDSFATAVHIIMNTLISIVGMKRLFKSIVEQPIFNQVYSELSCLFQTKKSLAQLLKLRILIALTKLDIARWQYTNQNIDLCHLKHYYSDFTCCSDFLLSYTDVNKAIELDVDFNTLSNAVELIAYISLQPDFKETIVNDSETMDKLFVISKFCKHSLSDSSNQINNNLYHKLDCCFFILKIFQNLINAHIDSSGTSKFDDIDDRMSKKDIKKLAKTAGKELPKKHEFDKKAYVTKRIEILCSYPHTFTIIYNIHECIKTVSLALNISIIDPSTNLTTSSTIYPMMASILQVLLWNQSCRGLAVQSGCLAILLFIFQKYSSYTGKINSRNNKEQIAHDTVLRAGDGLARIIISNNPSLIFKGDTIYEAIRPLLYIIKNKSFNYSNNAGLWCFEGLLALTNVLSIGDNVRKHFITIPFSYHTLETAMFDENERIVTSAIECASNLFICSDVIYSHFLPSNSTSPENKQLNKEKIKKFVFFANHIDHVSISIAATSALIHLVQYRVITVYFLGLDNFLPLLDRLLTSNNDDLMYRCAVIIYVMLNVLTKEEIKSYNITSAPFFDNILKMDAIKNNLKTGNISNDNFLIYLGKIIHFSLENHLIESNKII